MSTLTKLALGVMGRLRAAPPRGDSATAITLPPPVTEGGLPLLDALRRRGSERDFRPDPLSDAQLSGLLWAAFGVNRPNVHGRTAPSAVNAQEIAIYVALPQGAYRYDPDHHRLELVVSTDVRRVTGYQDFVDGAPLDLVYVADHTKLALVPVAQRTLYAAASAGAIAQNVYLYCASEGLGTVIRAWIDRDALAEALGLPHDDQILLAQTVGLPRQPA
ncbi:MAG: SagB/ThcOx family dehydrogenase [Sandaracinaceae bacterium]|nr:SagB/ThcOx family dehydrogenase [Sandaracinaceae bacterium]